MQSLILQLNQASAVIQRLSQNPNKRGISAGTIVLIVGGSILVLTVAAAIIVFVILQLEGVIDISELFGERKIIKENISTFNELKKNYTALGQERDKLIKQMSDLKIELENIASEKSGPYEKLTKQLKAITKKVDAFEAKEKEIYSSILAAENRLNVKIDSLAGRMKEAEKKLDLKPSKKKKKNKFFKK